MAQGPTNNTSHSHGPQVMTDTAGVWQYGVYFRSSDNVIMAFRRYIATDAYQYVNLGNVASNRIGSPNLIPGDGHYSMSIGVDGDNVVHVTGNQHSGDGVGSTVHRYIYCDDVANFTTFSSWKAPATDVFAVNASSTGPAYTYSLFDRMSDGTLLFAMSQDDYNNDTQGRDWIMWKKVMGSTSWSPVNGDGHFTTCNRQSTSNPFNAGGHRYNADGSANRTYMSGLYVQYRPGKTDRIHTSGCWRTANDSGASMQKPWYLYSDDAGTTWRAIDGSAQTMPITWGTRAAATVTSAAQLPLTSYAIVTSDPGAAPGLACLPLYAQGIMIDGNGYPHMFWMNQVDEFTYPQHWYDCYWNGTAWTTRSLGTQECALYWFRQKMWTRLRAGDFTNDRTLISLYGIGFTGVYTMGKFIAHACTPNPDPVLLREQDILSFLLVEDDSPLVFTIGNNKHMLTAP